ncbi:MFS transporter [Falsiroseomonas bella]|uniref:MFS transporter n=1 Tax=Falsiroseomonas bella TaxID=2184016 RepID=A0A317FBF2_9PROT|nr:MFS transporter [Falsiroseomonas bella]PWS35793.1 MFS transporter [Falsiroseomonas bella]
MNNATDRFGWRVVGAAFVVAAFGWGMGFYGPPVFLHAVETGRGWPAWLASAAVTAHFLAGAAVVALLPRLYRRFGIASVTRAGAVSAALGALGWALAAEPWQLFLATLPSGAGWAATGAAAINAIVSPWFVRRRPAALAAAFNGASVGGVVLSPLWVALIGWVGFGWAAALVGGTMVATLWWLAGRYLGRTPAGMGLAVDGAAEPAARPVAEAAPRLWSDRRFRLLVAANALGLFAQIGLVAHLVALLAPALGAQGAGLAMGLATACAIAGRFAMARLLVPGADRRRAAAANYGVQVLGSVLLLAAGDAPALLLLGVALFGFGLGNAVSLPPLIVQQEFREAEVARVVALVVATGQATYAFAPAGFGLLRAGDAPMLFLAAAVLQTTAALLLLRRRELGGPSPGRP